ncbi:MAG: hypothetical protein ACRD5B_09995 [Nitrososphaeraceae archaeon]
MTSKEFDDEFFKSENNGTDQSKDISPQENSNVNQPRNLLLAYS